MEKFLALPDEKQKTILDAALYTFGKLGYKKASANDIAAAAGISKGMIFHYFGSKKALYLYLVDFAGDLLYSAIDSEFDYSITDFFDRITRAMEIKFSVIKKHPAALGFLGNVYFETVPEVADDLKTFLENGSAYSNNFVLNDADIVKFKESVEPALVLQIIIRMYKGYASSHIPNNSFNLETIINEVSDCMKMMKKNFYKEEYL